MKKYAFILCLSVLGLSCSEDPVEILPTLTTDGVEDTSLISEFVFLATPNGSASAVFFPSGCLQSSNTCIPSGGCNVFTSAKSDFKLALPLSTFPNGQPLTLTACGLKSDGHVYAAGSGTLTNSKGSTVAIALSSVNTTACDLVPTVCP